MDAGERSSVRRQQRRWDEVDGDWWGRTWQDEKKRRDDGDGREAVAVLQSQWYVGVAAAVGLSLGGERRRHQRGSRGFAVWDCV